MNSVKWSDCKCEPLALIAKVIDKLLNCYYTKVS